MKKAKAYTIAVDIFLIVFSLGQLLLIAYFNLRSHVDDCSGPGFADGCAGGAFDVVGVVFGLLYLTALVGILVKSSISLYRTLRWA